MNLIFVTRIIDQKDTRSGFIFDWIKSFAKRVDHLYVICLEKGDTLGLPANVTVGSMGKEKGRSRLGKLVEYWKLLFCWAPKSKGVFIHMHPVYVIAGWLPIKIFGKKITLWYTHKRVDTKLKIANFLVSVIFTASKKSFRLVSRKVRVMGHGISLEQFARTKKPETEDDTFKMLSVGRISPSKDYETLIKSVSRLSTTNYQLDIYGDPALKEDKIYFENLKDMVKKLSLDNRVKFHGGVDYGKVPQLYAEADLFINLSKTGSLDKTVLEAGASKTLVLTSNEAFYESLRRISPALIVDSDNPGLLAQKIKSITEMPATEREKIVNLLYEWVSRDHGLDRLVEKIIKEF